MAGSVVPGTIQHRRRGVVRYNFDITCDASGVATTSEVAVGFGRLVGVFYNGGLDASAVITIADSKTGAALVTYTTSTEGVPVAFRPTTNIVISAGTVLAAHANNPNVNRDIYVGGGITVGVTSGGVSETAILSLIVDESGLGELAQTI